MRWIAPALVVIFAHLALGAIVSFLGRQPGEDARRQRASQARIDDECAAVWATLEIDPVLRGELDRGTLEDRVEAATGVPVDLRGWDTTEISGTTDWQATSTVSRQGVRWRVTLRGAPKHDQWMITTEVLP